MKTTENTPAEVTCRICTCRLDKPFRSRVDGKIYNGCVSDDHTGHLTNAEDEAWHDRTEAVLLRSRTRLALFDGIKTEARR